MKNISRRFTRNISMSAVTIFILATVLSSTLTANAAGFSGKGKGTVKSPYLVTNAAQLDEIRNNLSANYKLENNIDMSGVANFVPIGGLNAPFTGTFSCDAASDGTAKYIIKNLTVKINPPGATLAEKYSGYKKDGSMKWEAGLFGSANKAKFTNIVVLNATVTSTVEGNSQMNSDWSTNPGMSIEQSAGVLLGTGVDTTVTGCGASGTVTSASNDTGGLIGAMCASDGKTVTIKNCYSLVNVKSTGVWNSGGFLGGHENFWGKYNGKLRIQSCFYQGSFSGSYTNAGAFSGALIDGSIENCWTGGTVETSSSGCFYGTDVYNSGKTKNTDMCKNTYTISTITGRTKPQTNKNCINNNWITDAPGGLESGFAAGSMAEINAAFANLSEWSVTDGAYPQLKNVHAITSPESYNPVTTTDTATDTASATASVTVSADGTESKLSEAGSNNDVDTNEEDEQKTAGGVSTIIEKTTAKIGLAEKILFVVLSVIILLLIAATVFVIIRWFILIKRIKQPVLSDKKSNDDDMPIDYFGKE